MFKKCWVWFIIGYLASSGVRGCTTAIQQAAVDYQQIEQVRNYRSE